MTNRLRRRLALFAGVGALSLVACTERTERDGPGPPEPERAPAPTVDADTMALIGAAGRIVAFLRGAAPFNELDMADTVVFRLPPDAGGARRGFARAMLDSPSNWRIPAEADREYSLVPPPGLTESSFRPGTHLNCLERPLATVAPDLARMPHVGVQLRPPEAASCLQSWTATFVFAPETDPPRLIAVVYDQWEW